jgi:hypothetical protein
VYYPANGYLFCAVIAGEKVPAVKKQQPWLLLLLNTLQGGKKNTNRGVILLVNTYRGGVIITDVLSLRSECFMSTHTSLRLIVDGNHFTLRLCGMMLFGS